MNKNSFIQLPIKVYSKQLTEMGLTGDQNPSTDSFIKIRKDLIVSYRETEDIDGIDGICIEMPYGNTWMVYLTINELEDKIFS